MPAYKDKKTGLFYVQFYYRDARGARRHKNKKGFQTELEALLWEKNFKALKDDAMDMTFADFCKVYEAEVRPRVREHTWLTKENIIQSKLLPFFGDMRMCDIVARRHSQVAELPHGVHEARRRRLQAHVTEDHLCDADELDAGLQRQLSLVMEIFNGLGEAPPSGKRAASEKIWEAKHGQDR